MDNENTMQEVEMTEEADGMSAFDAGWDDDDWTGGGEESESDAMESDTEESEADQPDDDGSEGEGTDGDVTSEAEAEGEEGTQDQGESFTLRYLGEERTVNREDVIKLAQQGMDYNRIREKWDAVKDDVPRLRMYEEFLKELADTRDGDIDSLIDETRTRALISKAEAKGEKLDPAKAAAQAVAMRLGKKTGGSESSGAHTEEDVHARHERMVDEFIKVYGNSVQGTDIPNEVWEEASKTGDLIGPYQRHLSKIQGEEIKRLKKELEEAKQQQNNSKRSTGSSRSSGADATRDYFEEGWNDAD